MSRSMIVNFPPYGTLLPFNSLENPRAPDTPTNPNLSIPVTAWQLLFYGDTNSGDALTINGLDVSGTYQTEVVTTSGSGYDVSQYRYTQIDSIIARVDARASAISVGFTDAVASFQSSSDMGNLLLNGNTINTTLYLGRDLTAVLVTNDMFVMPDLDAHVIIMYSYIDNSAITFNVVGYDQQGNSVNEEFSGPAADATYTTMQSFTVITSISASAAYTSIQVGAPDLIASANTINPGNPLPLNSQPYLVMPGATNSGYLAFPNQSYPVVISTVTSQTVLGSPDSPSPINTVFTPNVAVSLGYEEVNTAQDTYNIKVVGTDIWGQQIAELASNLNGSGIVFGLLNFATITGFYSLGSAISSVTAFNPFIATNTGLSSWLPLDLNRPYANTAIQVNINDNTPVFSVNQTMDKTIGWNQFSAPVVNTNPTVFPINSVLTAANTGVLYALEQPAAAIQMKILNGEGDSGSGYYNITLTVIQQGE